MLMKQIKILVSSPGFLCLDVIVKFRRIKDFEISKNLKKSIFHSEIIMPCPFKKNMCGFLTSHQHKNYINKIHVYV